MNVRGDWAMPLYAAGGVLLAALAFAASFGVLQAGRQPERAVLMTGALLGAVLLLSPAIYIVRNRFDAQPGTAGLVFLTACAISLLAIYFYWVSSYVFFPADILIWAEGDFLNDITKFSVGYPIYSPQVNNDSFNYVPGAQLLTYFLAWSIGKPNSIPTFRVIQVCYAGLAAFIGMLCCRRILHFAFPALRASEKLLWNIFWYSALFLIATNSVTNHFAHNLHADSLAEVANLAAFYLLLRYAESRSPVVLAAMAVTVTVGFFIRQNALIWGVCYFGFLAIWDRSWKRLVIFSAAAASIFIASVAACYALWGAPFYYWVFYELPKHAISPLRSFQHGMDGWVYFAALFLGGAAVLRGTNSTPLLGAWLTCLLVLLVETYTSGLAWMLNHMGPGSVLAGVWFVAGLASVWNAATQGTKGLVESWTRAATLTAALALMFSGLGVIRIPLRPLPEDSYRYVHDIEKEFEGLPTNRVLLDLGDWLYFKDRVIVGDRATSIGDRGYSGIGDFSGILSRIATKHYSKIMVRGYHSFDFVYDYFLYPKSTGIRQALLDNYRETGKIRAVEPNPYMKDWAEDPYYFGEITILEPKTSPTGIQP